MSTMTLEQVRDWLLAEYETRKQGTAGDQYRAAWAKEMADAIDAHLRERESAEAGVTDEMVDKAHDKLTARCVDESWFPSLDDMRDALEAVASMLASARVPDGWQPTSANINALSLPIRKYIMMLETEADPAGTIRQNVLVSEENDMLRAALTEALAAAPKPEKE